MGNFGVPENGLDEMNLSFYVNFASNGDEAANMIEVDGEDVSSFQTMVTSRTIQAGEEILLPRPMVPKVGDVEVPFMFAASPSAQVDLVMHRLWGCNVVLRVSTVQLGGVGAFALQDMNEGERPFLVLHQADTIDIPRDLATAYLSSADWDQRHRRIIFHKFGSAA